MWRLGQSGRISCRKKGQGAIRVSTMVIDQNNQLTNSQLRRSAPNGIAQREIDEVIRRMKESVVVLVAGDV